MSTNHLRSIQQFRQLLADWCPVCVQAAINACPSIYHAATTDNDQCHCGAHHMEECYRPRDFKIVIVVAGFSENVGHKHHALQAIRDGWVGDYLNAYKFDYDDHEKWPLAPFHRQLAHLVATRVDAMAAWLDHEVQKKMKWRPRPLYAADMFDDEEDMFFHAWKWMSTEVYAYLLDRFKSGDTCYFGDDSDDGTKPYDSGLNFAARNNNAELVEYILQNTHTQDKIDLRTYALQRSRIMPEDDVYNMPLLETGSAETLDVLCRNGVCNEEQLAKVVARSYKKGRKCFGSDWNADNPQDAAVTKFRENLGKLFQIYNKKHELWSVLRHPKILKLINHDPKLNTICKQALQPFFEEVGEILHHNTKLPSDVITHEILSFL